MEKEYFVLRQVNCSNGGTDIIGITDDEEFAKSQVSVFCNYEKVKFLERDITLIVKELAETYHDRDVMSTTYADNQICDCCKKTVMATYCIEHDSQDYSKDKHVCSDCYVAIATYWKEHNPKKICPI
jgi:predicted AlkP superfamily phosphohydrolase/phosphomutase